MKIEKYRIELTMNNVLPEQLKHETRERFGAYAVDGVLHRGLNNIVSKGEEVSEHDTYLPKLIGINPNNDKFSAEATEYWNNFTITISADGLDIKYPVDKDGNLLSSNEDDIKNYIMANHLKNHPDVAFNEEDIENRDLYRAVMLNVDKQDRVQKDKELLQLEGSMALTKIISNIESKEGRELADRVAQINNVFNAESLDIEDLKIELKRACELNPVKFASDVKSPNLQYDVIITKGLTANVITLEGGTYYLLEQRIGDRESLIAWLKDSKNGLEVKKLKDKVDDAMKTLVVA